MSEIKKLFRDSAVMSTTATLLLAGSVVASDTTFEPKIACGNDFALAITEDGRVVAWGNNNYGQCNVPGDIVNPVRVAAWEQHAMVLQADGTVRVWGRNDYGQCDVPQDLPPVMDIDSLSRGSLVLVLDGSIRGWGDDYWCGSGTTTLDIPADLVGVQELAGGNAHWLYRADNGTIAGLGCNYNGQLNVPGSAQPPLDFESNESWSCVLGPDKRLYAMGWGGYGQLSVPGGNNFVDIACGHYFGLALTGAGDVMHWGLDNHGQGQIPGDLAMMDIVSINAGGGFGVAVHPEGSLTMWGANNSGECDWPSNERIRMGDVDCNQNDVPDWLEILRGTANDADGDGQVDDCDGPSCANGLQVPGDYSTIQAAIQAASDGCEIVIEPGVYSPIDLMGKSLVLRASGNAGDVIIDGQGGSRCVLAVDAGSVLIEGVVLRNGYVASSEQVGGGGIEASGTDLTLREVTIESCTATRDGSGYFDAEGGAIRLIGGSLQLESCVLSSNRAQCTNTGDLYSWGWARGGAVHLENVSAEFTDCIFEENVTYSRSVGTSWHNVFSSGGAVMSLASTLLLDSCTFRNNLTEVDSQSSGVAAVICGGAGLSTEETTVTMIETIFEGNEVRSTSSTTYYDNPASGAGAMIGGGGDLEMRECTFTGNVLAGGLAVAGTMRGAGLYLGVGDDSERTIVGCRFEENIVGIEGSSGGRRGGGLCTGSGDASLDAYLMIDGCFFSNNSASGGSALYFESVGNTVQSTVICGGELPQVQGSWSDAGGNDVLEECSSCIYDLNIDGIVDGADLSVLIGWWGTDGMTYPSPDLDENGVVDGADLSLLLGAWGECP